MMRVLLIAHLLVSVAMVGIVLLQKSEGGALGIGGGSGFMTGRQAGNLLTRTTAILAIGFITTSVALAILGENAIGTVHQSLLDQLSGEEKKSIEKNMDHHLSPERTDLSPNSAAIPNSTSQPIGGKSSNF